MLDIHVSESSMLNMMRSTMLITVIHENDSTKSFATGFLFRHSDCHCLITNNHILLSNNHIATQIDLRYNYIIAGKRFAKTYTINDIGRCLACEPNDSDDLVALSIDELIDSLDCKAVLDHYMLSSNHLPSDNSISCLSPVEEVYMIGYPAGLIDTQNGLPLVRKGITATPYQFGFMDCLSGDHSFALDIECVKGSSGSPVFLASEDALVLLGINKQNRFEDVAISSNNPKNRREELSYRHPIHISICTKANQLTKLNWLEKGAHFDLDRYYRKASPTDYDNWCLCAH